MNRRPVQSSNISSVGFEPGEDGQPGVMEVEFRNGMIYAYADVPEGEYQALLGAGSVGRYLNAHIIGTYDESRVK
jgi:hypothetical protein